MSAEDELAAALAAIPGYSETQTALTTARTASSAAFARHTGPDAALGALAYQVADSYLAGKTVPELGPKAYDAAMSSTIANAEVDVLRRVTNILDNQLGQIRRTGVDDALGHLHRQVTALVEELATASKALGPIRTADAAIDAGKTEAYATVMAGARRYEAIRSAQLSLYRTADSSTHYQIEAFAEIRNYAEIFPDWHTYATTGYVVDEETRGRMPVTPPWPDEPLDRLLWLVDNDAALWVPTLDQLATAQRAANEAASPIRRDLSPHPEPTRVR